MRRLLLLLTLLSLLLRTSYAQVSLVKGFPGVPTSAPILFEPLNNLTLFNHENGLWKSDGTTAGTSLLNSTAGFNSDFRARCKVGNTVFYVVLSSQNQLWKTDGTVTGTVLVKNVGAVCENLVNLNGLLLFTVRGTTNAELWRSDGTEAGTVLVTGLNGVNNGQARLLNTAVLDGYLYFSGPPVAVPQFGSPQPEVWRTDGTAAGTTRVDNGGYAPLGFNVINNKLIYASTKLYPGACPSDPTTTYSAKVIMKIEGNTPSVLRESATVTVCSVQRPLGNTFLASSKFIKAGNNLYFRGQEESNQGGNYNLWTTDGTTVAKLTNFNASTPGEGLENFFWQEGINDFGYDGIFLYPSTTANHGTELWRSDGTLNGTYLAKDIYSGTNGSNLGNFRTAGGITYFFASDGTRGVELWKSDGTTGGTVLVEAVNRAVQPVESAGNTNSYGHSVGNRYYFSGKYNNLQGLYTPCFPTVPTLSASPSNQVCPGGSATLQASGCNGTVNWSTGATGSSIVVSPVSTTAYTATCTETNCPAGTAASITITIKSIPQAPVISTLTCTDELVKIWDKRFGGNSDERLTSMLITTDGGYILAGTSPSGQNGDKSQPSQGRVDFWVVRINASGSKVWDKRFGGSVNDFLSSVVATPDGGFLLGGHSESGQNGDKSQPSQGFNDYWVVKIDADGNKVWDRRLGGTFFEELSSMIATPDGGFLLGGHSESGQNGDKSQPSQGFNDYWVVKIDADGNKVWDRRFGGTSDDNMTSLLTTNDGGYLLGGYSSSGISGDKSQASQGGIDYWVVKIDASGNKVWDKRFGGSAGDYLKSLLATNDGGYLLGGYSDSGISGDKSQASQGDIDYWVVKIDASGNKVWDKRFGGINREIIYSMLPATDGGYLLGGYSDSGISGDKSQASQGGTDYWVVKIDEAGNKVWDKRFGGNNDEIIYSMLSRSDGSYLLGGHSYSDISGDKSQTSQGLADFWVVRASACQSTTNLCTKQPTTLLASGCAGTVTWSTGANGASIIVTPQQSTTYSAVCTLNNCVSPASTIIMIVSCAMHTTKIGNWNDPSVWSENRVPGSSDTVTINHTITLPGNYTGQARRVIYGNVSRLLFGGGSRLNIVGN